MTAGQWYVSRGRIIRGTFWLYYVLPLLLLGLIASVIDVALGFSGIETTTSATGASAFYSLGPVAGVVALLTLVPSISSTVTRLHDQDKSAAWLLFLLLPVIGWLVLIVLCGFIPGTAGVNQYGRPPAGEQVAATGHPATYA